MKVQAYVPELIETGWYKARIKAITPEEGKFGPQLKWVFEIVAEPYAGQTLSAWVNQSMNTTGRLVLWGCAALGETVATEDTEFDTEDCVGRVVEIQVTEKTGKDGKVYNKVEDVRPPRKAKGKAKPQPEEEIEAVDDPFDKD